MKEFVLIFRNETANEMKLTPADIETLTNNWQAWMGKMTAQGQLANPGQRLGFDGKTVKPGNTVTPGPYAEIKEVLRGFTIINAVSIEEATGIAKGCPILNIGGNVEVRDVIPMNG